MERTTKVTKENKVTKITKQAQIEIDGEILHIVKGTKYWNDGSFNGKFGFVWTLRNQDRISQIDEWKRLSDLIEWVEIEIEEGRAKLESNKGGFVDQTEGRKLKYAR